MSVRTATRINDERGFYVKKVQLARHHRVAHHNHDVIVVYQLVMT